MLLVAPVHGPAHPALRRRPRRRRRRLDPLPQLAAARLHRRRHLDRPDLGRPAAARRRHRPLLHPDDDRRLRRPAHRPALRRDPADERPAAGRRRDRHRGPGGRPAARERRRHQRRRAGRRLRHRLLVGARDRRALADPLHRPAARRGPAAQADRRRGGSPRPSWSRSVPELAAKGAKSHDPRARAPGRARPRLPPRLPQPAQPARPRHPPARRRDEPRPVRAAGASSTSAARSRAASSPAPPASAPPPVSQMLDHLAAEGQVERDRSSRPTAASSSPS